VVDTLTDNDLSASSGRLRPGYERLLAMVDAGDLDVIVCWHVDRLTRRMVDLEDVITRCERAGTKVATVSGDLDLSTDAGRLVGRILASVARGEVERKSARQKRAALQSAEAGNPPTRRAFGFTPDGSAINPSEAAAVRDAYRDLLAGDTLVAITTRMNNAGHLSTRGNRWQRTMVRAMLLNSRNAAIRTYRGTEMGPGTWPAIVSEDTWRTAVSLLGDPARRLNKGTARRWLGAGLFLCGRCGADVRVNYRAQGERIYRCRDHAHLSRLADPVDDLVEQVVVARLRQTDVAGLVTVDDTDTSARRAEAGEVRARLDGLAADYAEGLLTGRQVQVATRRLQDRLTVVERELVAGGRASRVGALLSAADPGDAWLRSDLTMRRAVLDVLCTVTVLPGRPGRAGFDPETVQFDWKVGE
jgi:site-specific DNA recombinase